MDLSTKQISFKRCVAAVAVAFMLFQFLSLVQPSVAHAADVVLPSDISHACAGKKLIYRKHVDAAYITQVAQDEIDLKVVDDVNIVDPDQVCIRLAPDADANGNEVSRFAIPNDPALSFLGEPASIVWNAPSQYYPGWPPVWAGIGALEHELETLPLDNIKTNSIKMDLVSVDGPGKVEIYTYLGSSSALSRIFSSTDPNYKRTYMTANSHAHVSTSFSEPGVYRLKWQGHAELKNGQTISTPEREVTWVVGTDEQVGLPEGTTVGGARIVKSAEDFAQEIRSSMPEPSDEPKAEQAGGSEQDYEVVLPEDWGSDVKSDLAHISRGHLDLKIGWHRPDSTPTIFLKDESDPANPVKRRSDRVAIEVPDSALVSLPNKPGYASIVADAWRADKKVWQIPEVQDANLPWLGFNTEDVDYENLDSDGIQIIAYSYNDGRMVTGSYNMFTGDLDRKIDTNFPESLIETLHNRTHVHRAFYFNKPGVYQIEFEVRMHDKDQEYGNYDSFAIFFLVGDKTINASRAVYGIDPIQTSPADSEDNSSESDGSGDSDVDGGSAAGGSEHNGSADGSGDSNTSQPVTDDVTGADNNSSGQVPPEKDDTEEVNTPDTPKEQTKPSTPKHATDVSEAEGVTASATAVKPDSVTAAQERGIYPHVTASEFESIVAAQLGLNQTGTAQTVSQTAQATGVNTALTSPIAGASAVNQASVPQISQETTQADSTQAKVKSVAPVAKKASSNAGVVHSGGYDIYALMIAGGFGASVMLVLCAIAMTAYVYAKK